MDAAANENLRREEQVDLCADGLRCLCDFYKAMKIVRDSGYSGYVGIEYEGQGLSEPDGIKATKALQEKVFAELG